jgi:carbon storage regulator CsrA
MLIVPRKLGQALQVGPDIRVTFVDHRSGSTYIGVDAPDDVKISRIDEIPEHVQAKRQNHPEMKARQLSPKTRRLHEAAKSMSKYLAENGLAGGRSWEEMTRALADFEDC